MPRHVQLAEIQAMAKSGGNYTVASIDAPARWLASFNADYICDGTDDDLIINAVLAEYYANASGGGRVLLSPGTFNTSAALALYGSVTVTTPTVIIQGSGMNATYIKPAAGVHAFAVGKATQGQILDIGVLLDGASDGIHDIDGLVSGDGIGWRMRHFVIRNFSFTGTTAHTGWGINIQPFRTIIENIEGNTGPTGYTYPANGIKLSARSTPNGSSTFNAGDSVMSRVQISVSGLYVGQRALWIDTDDSTAPNYDSSYFNQMVFNWIGLRSNVTGRGTAFQIGHPGSNKIRSVAVTGMDFEQFLIGLDLYNTQVCTFQTFYTSLVNSGGIYFRTDNTGSVNNTVNNEWHMGTVGVFNVTQDVIIDANTDSNNPNLFYGGMVETSGGTARINGSAVTAVPGGVLVRNVGGVQRTGTRHPVFNEPLLPQAQVSGLSSALTTFTTGIAARQTINKTGLAKISGGTQQWGIPGSLFTSQGTTALTINEVRYIPFLVPYAVVLTAWQFEVTTAPASNANVRIGVYPADTDLQPTGAPLYDNAGSAVASAFTGVKTATGLSVVLTPGMYLVAINCDVTMSIRTITTGTPFVATAMGATPLIQRVAGTQTYGALPNPGTKWTTINASAGGSQHSVVWQWTE